MKGVPLILTAVMLGAVAQLTLKRGMQMYGEVSLGSIWGQLGHILSVPQVLIGFLLYGLSSILWIAVVSSVDISMAYPMVSSAYVVVFLGSWLLLGEQISPMRAVGLAVIVAGVVIISRT
jgi:drug/metabolite transporter (DMT)-like permease